ncbi:MAG: NUDIX hydrolase [Pseudohongiellaceae bacterium]
MVWYAHSTVATIVEDNDHFLMVEETDAGRMVFNQPAGHLDANETLFEAALRETLEETAWQVELEAFLGLYFYQAPNNGITYIRHCFIARPLELTQRDLDPEISAVHWLSREEILAPGFPARSPAVIRVLEDYLQGQRYPLDLIYHHHE